METMMNQTKYSRVNESNQGNESFWREHYEAFQSSGLNRSRYCRQHQLTYHRFLYWYRKFNQARIAKGDDSVANTNPFLPVHIDADQQSDPVSNVLCTLVLGADQRLEVHTPLALEKVVQILRRNIC